MNYTKKRHIEESNRILENRFLLNEVMQAPEEEFLNTAMEILCYQFNEFCDLKENPEIHNIFPKKEIRDQVAEALNKLDSYCDSGKINHTNYPKFSCVEVKDYIVGEKSSYIQGFMDIFGKSV